MLHFLRDSAILTVMANRAIEFDQFVHTLLSLFLRLLSSFFRFLLLIRIQGSWVPNLIVFQYVFSDMEKHSDAKNINDFIETFAQYYNEKVVPNTYIILNDINLGRGYGGGRDYFDQLRNKLCSSISRKGRFCNDNSKSIYYPRGYPYGENSDGEFPKNENRFDWSPWEKYSPFDTCASAQMIIKKVVKNDNKCQPKDRYSNILL